MRWLVLGLVLAGIWGSAAAAPAAERCYLDGWTEPLLCYRLTVGDGGEALTVAVAPALNGRGKEPLYLLAGGPGQAASDLAPLLSSLRKVNRARDLVLVDRRGAGLSGAFNCGFDREAPVDLPSFAQKLADCYSANQDYAHALNSRQAVEDLERVRALLGHSRIALWGGSWGTRTALLYQQWYPDSLSALVLDAVAPIESRVFLSAAAAEQALRELVRDCSADPACASLGDWPAQLRALLDGWDGERARKLPDPLTGAPLKEPLEAWMLANAVRAALYEPAAAAQVPYAIHQASRGNYRPLSGLVGLFAAQSESMALGLTFSVACAEEMHRISAEDIAADGEGSFLGDAFIRPFVAGCEQWPVAPRGYPAPGPRAHPVLLISGSADPITPPQYAEQHLGYLENRQHLIVEGGGHINSRRGCIPDLIAQFLDAPQQLLASGCVSDIRRPPFMVDVFGPALGAMERLDD